MQEVVKREEATEIVKNEKTWVRLCIVKAFDAVVPVYFPAKSYPSIGDIVYFGYDNDVCQSEILFQEYTYIDSELWTALMLATSTVPIKAIKYGQMAEVNWTEEEE